MAKLVSSARSHEPLEFAEREVYEAPPSALSNFFGIAVVVLAVIVALALLMVALRG